MEVAMATRSCVASTYVVLWNPDGIKTLKLKAPIQINSQPTFAAAANAVAMIPTSQIRIAGGVIWRTCFAISFAPFR
jgi:hypothetical protein